VERKLISEYERFHAGSSYGETGWKSVPDILPHLLALKPRSLIDYGCGQSDLVDILSRKCGVEATARFDPAIPMYAHRPERFFDVLINVDVLEHIPETEIDATVSEMASMAKDAIMIIDTGPAKKFLADGRNAHVSQHPAGWWLERLARHMASIREIPVRRRRRVGFKTWSEELPAVKAAWVRWRETVEVQSKKIMRPLASSSSQS
jgi:hypothetical protein